MLGWNLGQMGSSLEIGMVGLEEEPAHSLHHAEKTEKKQQAVEEQEHNEIYCLTNSINRKYTTLL